ncbi:STE3-domain-containing protein [Panus rudis PR-1116 ss-1]|nr:STE3-domain-containing protein [Panus rudis PR-1116 ss-1]
MLTLPIASFLSAVLSLLPLPHSWQARNVPVLSLATWLFVLNLCQGVNSIIWLSNYETEGTLWCDISTKLNIGAMSAIPASVFCISKYLELVSSQRASKLLPVSGWRSKFLDMFLCLCLPIVLMALHFVVQERRYDIIENIGCVPATFNAIPSILVVYLVPFLLIFGTFIYAAIAFHHFLRHRATFGTHIRCLDSTLTTASYFRLYVTSITFVGILVASTVLSLITMLSSPMHQRTHWSHVDLNLWSIMTYSVDDLPKATIRMLYALWWVVPTLGYLLSLFLSFGQENIALYQKALDLLRTKFTRRPLSEKEYVNHISIVYDLLIICSRIQFVSTTHRHSQTFNSRCQDRLVSRQHATIHANHRLSCVHAH